MQAFTRSGVLSYAKDMAAISAFYEAVLAMQAEGFEPAYAQQLNQAILEESERFVNESSHRVARERLRRLHAAHHPRG